jgi:DNA-binding phage protein
MNAPRNVSYQDYLLKSLKDPQEAAAYIDGALELRDSAALLLALRQVAKAHGMAWQTLLVVPMWARKHCFAH